MKELPGLILTVISLGGCTHSSPPKIETKIVQKDCPAKETRPEIRPKLRFKDVDCFVWSPLHLDDKAFMTIRRRPDGLLLNLVESNEMTASRVYRKLMTEGQPVPGFLGQLGWLMWCQPAIIPPPESLDRK